MQLFFDLRMASCQNADIEQVLGGLRVLITQLSVHLEATLKRPKCPNRNILWVLGTEL